MIRIVYVIPTLDQSGAERQLTLLATGLPRDEYEPHVIALNRGGHYAQVMRDHGIPVHVLGKRFRFDPLTWFRLHSRLKAIRPHIIQSCIFAANSYVRLPGVRPAGSQLIVSERCVDSWKSDWQKSLDVKLSGRMDVMTANSQSVADFYRDEIGIAANVLHVIPNGVAELPAAEPGRLHREIGVSDDYRLIGFAGRLAPQKNLRDLIWAFHLLKQAVTVPLGLVLIGDGPQRDSLAKFATDLGRRDQVFFTGHRDDAASLIPNLAMFCLPSAFEGMSNSLMEAMACGLPCVVSDISPNRELIQHEQNGLVFPVGDTTLLAKTMLRCLDDQDHCSQLGQTARETISREYSVMALVQRHQDLYQRLVENSQRGSAIFSEDR
ncbi:MAG: glycosyltransferase [Fuerstiella sp.]|nr:glycosyltransferase [Fuerstiella sp.]